MCSNAKEKADKAIANLRNANINEQTEINDLISKLMKDIKKERKLSDEQIFRNICR